MSYYHLTSGIKYPLNIIIELFYYDEERMKIPFSFPKDIVFEMGKRIIEKSKEIHDDREKTILKLRYEDCLTYREIGEKLGISSQRVQQIKYKALRRLRHPSRSRYILEQAKEYLQDMEMETPTRKGRMIE